MHQLLLHLLSVLNQGQITVTIQQEVQLEIIHHNHVVEEEGARREHLHRRWVQDMD